MYFLVLLIGLCIGSFLNVCIYRIQREESISFPPSHCTSCGYELKPLDLIPVLSYLFLRGRCRKCKDKISMKYPFIEILNGVLYLILFSKFGVSINFVFYAILTSLLIVTSTIDIESKYVYNSTTIFGLTLGIIYIAVAYYFNHINVFNNILGGIVGYLIIFIIVKITNAMGEGDADIAGICGLFIGVKGILVALFLAIVIAGIIASIILILKIKDRKSEIAFSQYIAIGTFLWMIIGNNLLKIYFQMFNM